jgi:hypothetical protein
MTMRASSRHALRIALAALAGLFVALPATADAPEGQYVAFVRNSPTIQDNYTKLEWERFFTRTLKSGAQAEAQCVAFGSGGRIPTIKELFTLLDEEPHSEYEFNKTVVKMIHQPAFGATTGVDAAYWSSTPAEGIDKVWGLSFADGKMVELDASSDAPSAYIRCVR